MLPDKVSTAEALGNPFYKADVLDSIKVMSTQGRFGIRALSCSDFSGRQFFRACRAYFEAFWSCGQLVQKSIVELCMKLCMKLRAAVIDIGHLLLPSHSSDRFLT